MSNIQAKIVLPFFYDDMGEVDAEAVAKAWAQRDVQVSKTEYLKAELEARGYKVLVNVG